MSDTLTLQVRAMMEQLRLHQDELARQAKILYVPNGTMPLTQSIPLLTQRIADLTDDVTVLRREVIALDATMTAEHAAMREHLTALRLTMMRVVSLAVGGLLVLQVVVLPLVLKWAEKLFK